MNARVDPWRIALSRGVAGLVAVTTTMTMRPATGAPADVFVQTAPTLGTDPPKAADLKAGDASVATTTGALDYAYPVSVPPGRNGMAPKVSLAYSSQGAIYGGLASGWSLPIPAIMEDHSVGRLKTRSPEVEANEQFNNLDYRADDRFVSSMAGGQRLVGVVDWTLAPGVYSAYRAVNDASFARYERMQANQPFRWRVQTTDGMTMIFGDSSVSGKGTYACTSADQIANLISDRYAPLTSMTDAFGNSVQYVYEQVNVGECRIKEITWGHNPGAGFIGAFARVAFNWTTPPACNGVVPNSQTDYRSGIRLLSGASKLTSIVATAFAPATPSNIEHTRQIDLKYNDGTFGAPNVESCTQNRSPLRQLASIQESAWGVDAPLVTLPPVKFSYNPTTVLTTDQTAPLAWLDTVTTRSANLAWGYRRNDDRWPTVEAMLLDIDGDGRLDRVTNPNAESAQSSCTARWVRNMGAAGWQQPANFEIALPRLKWRGSATEAGNTTSGSSSAYRPLSGGGNSFGYENCSLNGQVTAWKNSFEQAPGFCHVAPGANAIPCTVGKNDCPGGTRCPYDSSGPYTADYRTYLAYRWLDVDSDGLVDLVAAVHGKIDAYDIERGNLVSGPNDYRWGEPAMSGIPGVGQWPACPGQQQRCADLGRNIDGARNCSSGPCTYNWDLVNSVVNNTPDKPCSSVLARAAGDGGGGSYTPSRTPYTRCDGLYPWVIFKNQGNGVFATTPIIKYQPIPLESDTGDSSLHGPSMTAQHHGILDFDGDGILDAVVHGKIWALSNPDAIFVWLGDGTGGFGPKRYTFPTRPKGAQEDDNALSGTKPVGSTIEEGLGLRDINGDGLLDHWLVGATANNVAIHDGSKNRLVNSANGPAGELTVTSALNNTASFTLSPSTGFPQTGTGVAQFRQIDVDADGRIDTVDARTTSPLVYWNYGGGFATGSSAYPHAHPANSGLWRNTIGTFSGSTTSLEPYAWELKSDLVDLDGNGVPENIYFDTGTHRIMETSPTTPQRLLSQIKNGSGATTTITYTHMHDSPTVIQNPAATWPDGRPKASPRSQWVVKSMQTVDEFASTTSTTSYAYKHPRFSADDEGKYAFRGFEEVTTTANSGAKTVQTYAFDVDKTGRLVKTATFSAETPTNPISVSRTTWQSRLSLNGAVKTFHATLSESFTCGNGLTEAQCTTLPVTNATTGYTQTVSTLTAYPSTGTALLWQEDTTLLRASNANADGDREAKMTATLVANATQYFFRPLGVIKNHRVSGVMVTYAQSATTWDPTWRVPLTKETWIDGVAANRSIARTEYDMATGNPTEQFKPNQNAASTTKTVLEYDARKLFPTKVTNEAGHVVDTIYEYGTGTKLQTDGPNTRTCVVGQPNCPADALHPPREQHRIKIDGLGRMLERWTTVGDETQYVYKSVKAETASYVDAPPSGVPTSVTTQSVIDESEATPRWTQQKTEHDGHGRPIKTTVFVQGTAPADHVTTYVYNANGSLTSVSVPDPRVNTSAQVTYLYTFDSLGRPLTIRRPGSTPTESKSGADLSYDGRKQNAVEVVGTAGGNPGQAESWVDFYGRVIQLKETSAASTFQTTTYAYDPLDNVKSIVDPQGGTITMQHDLAGRRTQITRPGNRTWKYTYDRNGNITSEQVPGSTNPPITDPLYTNTFAYDDLDRVTSKVLAPRQLSTQDRDLFLANSEAFTYDVGFIGSLRHWRAYGVSVGAEMAVDTYADGLGRTTLVSQTHAVAGYPAMSRSVGQGFNVNGSPRFVRQYDFMGGSNETIWTYRYDERGLPSKIQLMTPQAIDLAVQTRNVAGLVTNRRTTFATGPMGHAESVWTYDMLGRVTVQLVQKNTSPTQIARQAMQYTGTDDVKQMIHAIGSTNRTLDYTYDHRHQLKMATSGTYFGGTYNYGNAGRLTSANQTRTASGILGADPRLVRNVNYAYGSTDPERVTALTNVSNGSTYASYSYDDAGNQLTRTYPASNELFEYVYDGKDQLRRVTRKLSGSITGSEEYWYDADGQRMAVLKRNASGAKTELIWFIGEAQAHYNGTGALTKIYSHLSMGTPVARIERTSNTATSLELQFHGLASNTIAAVAQDGTINARFAYAPFGEVLEATIPSGGGQSSAHKRRFNDKFEDDIGKLTYYGARYYDKVLLGWTQADPLYLRAPDLASRSTPRRSQTFMFSLNNPNRYLDPDGLDSISSNPAYRFGVSCSDGGCIGVIDSGPASHEPERSWMSTNSEKIAYEQNVIAGQFRGAAAAAEFDERQMGGGGGGGGRGGGPGGGAGGLMGAAARLVQACKHPICTRLVQVSNNAMDRADRVAKRVNDAIERTVSALFAPLNSSIAGVMRVAARYDPKRADHIFRSAPGHVNAVSAGSRARFARLFEAIASNPANLRTDAVHVGLISQYAANAGVQAFTWTGMTGQVWVTVRNGLIQNAGVNPWGAFR
ncbi:MAG: toxin TcdB middle/N-terminal domain-containing protein [Kofleriaceae bacterium]